MLSRRRFLATTAALGAGVVVRTPGAAGAAIRKPIPATGETLPVIGMGSSRTFDTDLGTADRARLGEVLRLFFDGGGTLIDSSPMYGDAESVLGELLARTPGRDRLFAATKVWTDGRDDGIEQMKRSMQRMRVERFDLMQIHNLRDWATHLETLQAWKREGRIRYLGVTTSHGRFHDELERLLREHPFDFVQLSYSIGNREVERRLLPVAMERGVAVLVNRPFQRGALFRRVRGAALPAWAQEYGIGSWAQLFLKYAVSHPAVTCAIPATSKPKHMRDNMGAGFGPLPDAAARTRMQRFMDGL
jgi:aryl-alcohol dehydrogenase-like predicted oxidoreductase